MNIKEIKSNLCFYDLRNPEGVNEYNIMNKQELKEYN